MAWQFQQKIPVVATLLSEAFQAVLGPRRMNFAAEPCGPTGSVFRSEPWQSEQRIRFRLAVLHAKLVVTRLVRLIAPRLLELSASTGWKEPAVSPPLYWSTVPAVFQLPALAGLNSRAASVSV